MSCYQREEHIHEKVNLVILMCANLNDFQDFKNTTEFYFEIGVNHF